MSDVWGVRSGRWELSDFCGLETIGRGEIGRGPIAGVNGYPPRDGCAETCESIGEMVHDKLGIRFVGHENPVSASDKPGHIVLVPNSGLVLGVPEHAMELDFRTSLMLHQLLALFESLFCIREPADERQEDPK